MQERKEESRRSAETSLGRCLVDGDSATESLGRRTRRKTFGMSFAIEAAIVALLVVSPLLTSVAQPQLRNAPPMPIVLGTWRAHPANQPVPNKPTHSVLQEPELVPQIAFPVPNRKLREDLEADNSTPELPGEPVSGALEIPGAVPTPLKAEVPHIDPPVTTEKRIEKVSEGVEEAQLISRIEPQYPALARQTRMAGTVRLRAVISREGRISGLEVLSGPPLLVQAAVDAVRQWRYRPTLLSGEPVEVETSITVVFRLND